MTDIKYMPHVTVEQVLALRKAAKQLQTENEELKAELSSVVAGLFSEVEINKIKANAIREAAIMPKWGGQPDDIPSDFDGYCQAIHGMHEYANNLTKS